MSFLTWYFEGLDTTTGKVLRVPINPTPFSVGRAFGRELVLSSQRVSGLHAEIFERDEELWLRDCDSTNGTFINGNKIEGEHPLVTGDIVHFADVEFQVDQGVTEQAVPVFDHTVAISRGDSASGKFREFREMLRERGVQTLFQPIVTLNESELLSYEVLGRGVLDGMQANPGALFGMAEALGLSAELSRLFREKGMDESLSLPDEIPIFLNSHPAELQEKDSSFLQSLRALHDAYPKKTIVLEVHESAITSVDSLKQLMDHLGELNIDIAFDDFGAGQSRLLEMAEAAPRYVKFDASLIQNIHEASPQRQDMVKALVNMALDLNILTIAEGIEKPEEASVCSEMGFQYGQGYLFGRPAPVEDLTDPDQTKT